MHPTIAMHVRQGDKAGEMHIVQLDAYMKLAEQVRLHHPSVRTILLSTEMEVRPGKCFINGHTSLSLLKLL
jgi:hypothetical protein